MLLLVSAIFYPLSVNVPEPIEVLVRFESDCHYCRWRSAILDLGNPAGSGHP